MSPIKAFVPYLRPLTGSAAPAEPRLAFVEGPDPLEITSSALRACVGLLRGKNAQ